MSKLSGLDFLIKDLAIKHYLWHELTDSEKVKLMSFSYDLVAGHNPRIAKETDKRSQDMVNNPPHYKAGSIECIDAIKSALSAEEFRGYCKGNALKYVWREAHKGQDESLKKAIWYLNKTQEQ